MEQEGDDASVVHRVLKGDVDAFAVLVEKYRPQLTRYAQQMLGNRDDADDAIQESFVRAYRALPRCEDPSRFGAWVFRILVNRCRTIGGRRNRHMALFPVTEQNAPAAVRTVPDAATTALVERDAWREEIERALRALSPEQREAFLLRYVEELGYEEIAQMTGARVSALKMRVMRACERMRGMLEAVRHAS